MNRIKKIEKLVRKGFNSGLTRPELGVLRKLSRNEGYSDNTLLLEALTLVVIPENMITFWSISSGCSEDSMYEQIFNSVPVRGERFFINIEVCDDELYCDDEEYFIYAKIGYEKQPRIEIRGDEIIVNTRRY